MTTPITTPEEMLEALLAEFTDLPLSCEWRSEALDMVRALRSRIAPHARERDALWIEYCELLTDDWKDIVGLAAAHGYEGTPPERIERGKRLRAALGYDPEQPILLQSTPPDRGSALRWVALGGLEDDVVRADTERLDWLAVNATGEGELVIDGGDLEPGVFMLWRLSDCMGRGPTLRAAIDAARQGRAPPGNVRPR